MAVGIDAVDLFAAGQVHLHHGGGIELLEIAPHRHAAIAFIHQQIVKIE